MVGKWARMQKTKSPLFQAALLLIRSYLFIHKPKTIY